MTSHFKHNLFFIQIFVKPGWTYERKADFCVTILVIVIVTTTSVLFATN